MTTDKSISSHACRWVDVLHTNFNRTDRYKHVRHSEEMKSKGIVNWTLGTTQAADRPTHFPLVVFYEYSTTALVAPVFIHTPANMYMVFDCIQSNNL